MTTQHEALWAGKFGDDYTERNRVNWKERVPFWERIMTKIMQPGTLCTVLEVGCNAGWNLRALQELPLPIMEYGIDVNRHALNEARAAGLRVIHSSAMTAGRQYPGHFDLVFTAGVLIHVPPEDLVPTMKSIAAASSRHVLAIEYEAPEETEILYQGAGDRLWKRPYGDLYESIGMELEATGDAGPGFDNCTYWLMRQP